MFAAALGMLASPVLARPHIHKMPRQPTGMIRPAPIVGVGEHPIADNFVYGNGIEAGSTPTPGVGDGDKGAFRLFCRPNPAITNVDPIVYPGGVSPHGHQFYGNEAVTANSTYVTLRQFGGTTCGGTSAAPTNRSAYWQPAMRDGQGSIVLPYAILIYYKRYPKTDTAKCATQNTGNVAADLTDSQMGYCIAIPNGLRFVKGYNMTSGLEGPGTSGNEGLNFECRNADNSTYGEDERPNLEFDCPAGKTLVSNAYYPLCWNGTQLDSANHRDHVAAPAWNGTAVACPRTHPYYFPELSIISFWKVDSTFPTWELTSDNHARMMGRTVARGSTFHVDYHEAWSPTAKAAWTDNCIDRHMDCNNGTLGDGNILKDAGTPAESLVRVSAVGVN
jgi:hypothetical protein